MDYGRSSSDVDGVIITGELDRRPSRAPDYQAENQALTALAEALYTNSGSVLQRLVDLTLELTRSGSAGISLLEPDGENGTFRWVATAGAWSSYRGRTMPHEQSPCGEVITRNSVLLMRQPERAFLALLHAEPGIGEGLLAPFTINGAPAGTLWAIMHSADGRFEAEDARLLRSLARFASIAHQMALVLRDAQAGKLESDARLRALARASSDVFYIMNPDMTELRDLSGGDFIVDTTSPSRAWLKNYIPPDDHLRTAAAIAEAIRTKRVFELEHRVYQADGKIGWALSRAVPIFGAGGQIVEWFGAASDVTARKSIETALHDSKERQAFLLRLSDALRAEPSADSVAKRALRMLFEHMRLDRCYIGIYWLAEDIGDIPQQVHHDHLLPLPAQVRLSDFAESLQVLFDRSLVIDDVLKMEDLSGDKRASFANLGVGALVNATPRKSENIPLWAVCAVSSRSRSWTQGEVSLVEEVAERTWAALERVRAEAALRESEARYHALFAASPVPFMVLAPNAPDFSITAANDAYLAATLTTRESLIGRRLFDVLPDDPSRLGQLGSEALAISLERVVKTRTTDVMERVRYDLVVPDDGFEPHWWEAINAPILDGSGEIIAIIHQATRVTERHYREAVEQEEQARQAFLLELSDAVRPLIDPSAIERTVVELLGKHLGVSRVFYATVNGDGESWSVQQDYSDGLPSCAGTYPLSGFQQRRLTGWRAGHVSSIADSEADPSFDDTDRAAYAAFGARAAIGVPMVKGGRFVALLAVNHAEPREWTIGELALARETAERTWAAVERARAEEALRESQARLTAAFESVPLGAAVIDMSGSTVIANAEFRRFLPTGVIPSRDPERAKRWRGWDAEGKPLGPTDFPGARAMRGEHVVPGQEMLYTDDNGREIWTSVATAPIRNGDGQVTGHVCAISNIDALKRSIEALRESEGRFRQFSHASTNILWIRNAATMRMEFASPAFDRIYGIPGPERGGDPSLRAWARLIEPESRKDVLANFKRVRDGERIEVEFRFKRASDGTLRWVRNTDFPLRDAEGNVRWLAGLGADITDAKEAADRRGVLVAELQHRTRNLIAVVSSLSDRTLGNASSLEDFGKRFRQRLAALSRVQGLLSHLAAGERVEFDELVRSELTAHGAMDGVAGKVTLDGPAGVALRSGTVQTLALALHELATNAVKYGALAGANGHLTVRWYVEPEAGNSTPVLRVEWQESGVVMPEISEPSRGGGYGREMIERALPYQLGAKTSYALGVDGVRCTIAVRISGGGSKRRSIEP